MASSGYAVLGWTLPLPQALCQRIRTQIRHEQEQTKRDDQGPTTAPGANSTPHAKCAVAAAAAEHEQDGRTTDAPMQVRLDIHLEVDATQAAAVSPSSSHASGSTAGAHSNGEASAASASAPLASPLSLSDLHAAVAFILQHFPFGSLGHAIDGVATFLLVWGRLGAGGPQQPTDQEQQQQQQEEVPTTNQSSSKVPFAPPAIRRARIHAQVMATSAPEKVLAAYSIDRRADQERLLGRDVNAWGDVDIVLQVEPPPTTMSATLQPTSSPSGSSACCHCAFPSAGLYCLNLWPRSRIPLHVHRILDESELIFSHGIRVQDDAHPAEFGTVHSWDRLAHEYSNPTDAAQRILCVDVPMFIPSDEVVVERAGPLTRPKNTGVRWHAFRRTPTQWLFPGGLANQTVRLTVDEAAFQTPHAVLLFAYGEPDEPTDGSNDDHGASAASSSPSLSASSPRLLFVHHAARGWELPGGKVDANESPLDAVRREAQEEAGAELTDVRQIAQYTLTEEPAALSSTDRRHVKSVFVARVRKIAPTAQLQHETKDARLMAPPVWQAMVASQTHADPAAAMRFSRILNDNVYPLCLQLSLAALV